MTGACIFCKWIKNCIFRECILQFNWSDHSEDVSKWWTYMEIVEYSGINAIQIWKLLEKYVKLT